MGSSPRCRPGPIRSKFPRIKIAITLLSIIAGISLGRLVPTTRPVPRPSPPVASPPSQTIRAGPGDSHVTAIYRITNPGDRELALGDVSTTCGCSVASIEPKLLGPGREAVVRVVGEPPKAGEKTVEILVSTNSAAFPTVTMQLTMVGPNPIPFLSFSSGPVRFGTLTTAHEPETIRIETLERSGTAPWIGQAMGTPPGLDLRGGLSDEDPSSAGVVWRKYSFTARFSHLPEPGDFRGELVFSAPGPPSGPILSLPVVGSVPRPVRAEPSALVASFERGRDAAPVPLSLVADDPGFDLKAELVSDASPDRLIVRETSRQPGSVTFSIVSDAAATGPSVGTLVFNTNHPRAGRVKVPVRFSTYDAK